MNRLDHVKIKLAAIEETIKGKRVVLVDDSIVRGNTIGRVIALLRDTGAREVHVRISSPPFLHPCYYGTDIDSEEGLVACPAPDSGNLQADRRDSLGYFPVELYVYLFEQLHCLAGKNGFCSACFNGEYPTKIPGNTRKDRFETRLSELAK